MYHVPGSLYATILVMHQFYYTSRVSPVPWFGVSVNSASVFVPEMIGLSVCILCLELSINLVPPGVIDLCPRVPWLGVFVNSVRRRFSARYGPFSNSSAWSFRCPVRRFSVGMVRVGPLVSQRPGTSRRAACLPELSRSQGHSLALVR